MPFEIFKDFVKQIHVAIQHTDFDLGFAPLWQVEVNWLAFFLKFLFELFNELNGAGSRNIRWQFKKIRDQLQAVNRCKKLNNSL